MRAYMLTTEVLISPKGPLFLEKVNFFLKKKTYPPLKAGYRPDTKTYALL